MGPARMAYRPRYIHWCYRCDHDFSHSTIRVAVTVAVAITAIRVSDDITVVINIACVDAAAFIAGSITVVDTVIAKAVAAVTVATARNGVGDVSGT